MSILTLEDYFNEMDKKNSVLTSEDKKIFDEVSKLENLIESSLRNNNNIIEKIFNYLFK